MCCWVGSLARAMQGVVLGLQLVCLIEGVESLDALIMRGGVMVYVCHAWMNECTLVL